MVKDDIVRRHECYCRQKMIKFRLNLWRLNVPASHKRIAGSDFLLKSKHSTMVHGIGCTFHSTLSRIALYVLERVRLGARNPRER